MIKRENGNCAVELRLLHVWLRWKHNKKPGLGEREAPVISHQFANTTYRLIISSSGVAVPCLVKAVARRICYTSSLPPTSSPRRLQPLPPVQASPLTPRCSHVGPTPCNYVSSACYHTSGLLRTSTPPFWISFEHLDGLRPLYKPKRQDISNIPPCDLLMHSAHCC
jgi:hypothetical protein